MQTIVMPDGVTLSIPPEAIDSGTVTLFIFPTHELRPEPDREIIGPGYEIWAVDETGQEITLFNKSVAITFTYEETPGVDEQRLVPVYFSTLVGHWILAESYVLDVANNQITLQIDHFTKFGVMSASPTDITVYLPLILRSN